MPLTRSQASTNTAGALESTFIEENPFDAFSHQVCEEMIMKLHTEGLKTIIKFLHATCPERKVEMQNCVITLLNKNFKLIEPKVQEIYDELMKTHRGMQVVTHFSIYRKYMLKNYHVEILETLKVICGLESCNIVRLRQVQAAMFDLQLTPEQTRLIHTNRLAKEKHDVQVQLYVSFMQTTSGEENFNPFKINVVVNKRECNMPVTICNGKQSLMTGLEECSIARLNITPNLVLSSCAQNSINVKWNTKHHCVNCLFVVLARDLKSAKLLEHLKMKCVKPADYTHDLIQQVFSEKVNQEVVITMLLVSLICPIGKAKMLLPCRASTCSHLQCFDAGTYLQMNERRPTWKCPICSKPAIYADLIIDGYFLDVLNSKRLKGTNIQLNKDGSWSIPNMRSTTADKRAYQIRL